MPDYVSKFTGTEIDDAIQKSKDISKTANEINTSFEYTDKIKSSIDATADNEIIYKNSNGDLTGSGIVNETDKIFFNKDGRFPSGSIDIGSGITLSENGGWVQNTPHTLDKNYIMLDYENDSSGSQKPIYWKREAEQIGVIINNGGNVDMTISSINYIPTTNSQVNKVYLNLTNPVENLIIEVVSNVTNKPIKYIPNESAWKNNVGGLNLDSGVQNILYSTPISLLTSYDLRINFKNPIIVKGDGNLPYIAVDRQLITPRNILIEGDSAGESTFLGLTDTPSNYTNQAGKFVMVDPSANGLIFADGTSTVDINSVPDVTFKTKGVQSGLATDKLDNVSSLDFEKRFLTTDAYQKIAQYMSIDHKGAVEQANELTPSDAIDLSAQSGFIIFLDYQFTGNNQVIRQTLPPVSQGKYIMFATIYPNPYAGTQIILSPASGETLNGSDVDYTITRSGFLGFAVPTQDGYVWIQSTSLSSETGNTIRDKLETLTGNARLSKDYIKGVSKNNYVNPTSEITISPDENILIYDAQIPTETPFYSQLLPQISESKSLIIYVNVNAPKEKYIIFNPFGDGTVNSEDSVNIYGGDQAILFGTENEWKFYPINFSTTRGVNIQATPFDFLNTVDLEFVGKNVTKDNVTNTVLVEDPFEYAKIDLANVLASDFDNKLKNSAAYKELASKIEGYTPDQLKDVFEANYYEENSSVNIESLQGNFLSILYQGSNNGIIQQTLPPSSSGKALIIQYYKPTNIELSTLEILPYPGQTINGESRTLTFLDSAFVGLFIPLSGNQGYEYFSQEVLHDSNISFKNKDNEIFTDKKIFAEDPIYIEEDIPNESAVFKLNKTNAMFESPSYLAYYEENTLIAQSRIESDIFSVINPPDVQVNTFVQDIKNQDGSYRLKGGYDYIVAFRLSLEGVSFDNDVIKIYLQDVETKAILEDTNGNPCAFARKYNSGQKLGYIELVSVIRLSDDKDINFIMDSKLVNTVLYVSDTVESITGIMIQQISTGKDYGAGLTKYEIDTEQNIQISKHDFNKNISTVDVLKQSTYSDATIPSGSSKRLQNGYGLDAITNVVNSVANGEIIIKDDGNLAYFDFNYTLSLEKTVLLRNKSVGARFTIANPNSGFYAQAFYWEGSPEEFPERIITGISNTNPVWETGITALNPKVFFSENLTGDTTNTVIVEVPEEATIFGFAIYPADEQSPINLTIKEFTVKTVDPFIGYSLYAPNLNEELHLKYDDEFLGTNSFPSPGTTLRYTINSNATKLPLGAKLKGNAPITLSRDYWTDSGYNSETTAVFTAGGKAKIYNYFIVYGGEGQTGTSTTLTIWYGKKRSGTPNPGDVGYTFNPSDYDQIPESVYTTTINKTDSAIEVLTDTWEYNANVGDVLVLFATTTENDGAYIQGVDQIHSFSTMAVDFEGYVTEKEEMLPFLDRISLLENPDMITIIKTANLTLSTTAQTIAFDTVVHNEAISNNNGVITIAKTGLYYGTLKMYINQTTNPDVWVWVEKSADGTTWNTFNGIASKLRVNTDSEMFVSLNGTMDLNANDKIRVMVAIVGAGSASLESQTTTIGTTSLTQHPAIMSIIKI